VQLDCWQKEEQKITGGGGGPGEVMIFSSKIITIALKNIVY